MNWFSSVKNGVGDMFSGKPIDQSLTGYWSGVTGKGGGMPGGGGGGGANYSTAGIPLLSGTPGYAAAEGEALRTGASPWANMATAQQEKLAADAIDQGVNQNAGSTAAADAALASTGGLSSGARERIQEGGDKNLMAMAHGVDQNLANNVSGISSQDSLNRINQLNSFNNLNQANVANQDAAVASSQTAQAISQAPTSSGCFVTTAMCDFFGLPDDCHELQAMRAFRDNYVAKNSKIKHRVAEYYMLAKKWDKEIRMIHDTKFWRRIRRDINKAVFLVNGKHKGDADFDGTVTSDRNWQAYCVYRDMVYFVRREVYKRRILAAINRPWTVIKSYFNKGQIA